MTEAEIAQILERLDHIEKHLADLEALLEPFAPFVEPRQLGLPHQLGMSRQLGMLQQPGYTISNSPTLTETPASANRPPFSKKDPPCPKPG